MEVFLHINWTTRVNHPHRYAGGGSPTPHCQGEVVLTNLLGETFSHQDGTTGLREAAAGAMPQQGRRYSYTTLGGKSTPAAARIFQRPKRTSRRADTAAALAVDPVRLRHHDSAVAVNPRRLS